MYLLNIYLLYIIPWFKFIHLPLARFVLLGIFFFYAFGIVYIVSGKAKKKNEKLRCHE